MSRTAPASAPADIPVPPGHQVHHAVIGKRGEHSLQFPSRGLNAALLWDPTTRAWVKASEADKGWKHYRAIALPLTGATRA